MLTNTPSTPAVSRRLFDRYPSDALQARVFDQRARREQGREEPTEHEAWRLPVRPGGAIDSAVQIHPVDSVRRRAMSWNGMAAEIVQVTRRERAEFRFQAPRHLLIVHEQGARHDGETMVEGRRAILPEITGTSYLTGFSQFLFDPNDPVRTGFLLEA